MQANNRFFFKVTKPFMHLICLNIFKTQKRFGSWNSKFTVFRPCGCGDSDMWNTWNSFGQKIVYPSICLCLYKYTRYRTLFPYKPDPMPSFLRHTLRSRIQNLNLFEGLRSSKNLISQNSKIGSGLYGKSVLYLLRILMYLRSAYS